MTKDWVPIDRLLSGFADDLDDERADEAQRRARRAADTAAATLARLGLQPPPPEDVDDDIDLLALEDELERDAGV